MKQIKKLWKTFNWMFRRLIFTPFILLFFGLDGVIKFNEHLDKVMDDIWK